MEVENEKLKTEVDDLYKALTEKENMLQSNKNDVSSSHALYLLIFSNFKIKKLEDMKKHLERLKADKAQLNEENRKVAENLRESKLHVEDLKAEIVWIVLLLS